MSFYIPLFKSLNEADVQYIVLGGLATVLHGYARLTADIDLVINLNQQEAEKAVKAITAIGLKPRLPVDPMQFVDETTRESWINDKNMMVFSFFNPTNPLIILDVFVREPFPFGEMLQRSVTVDIGGVNIHKNRVREEWHLLKFLWMTIFLHHCSCIITLFHQ